MIRNTLYDLTHRMPYMDADTGAEGGADTGNADTGAGAERTIPFDEALKTPGYQAEFDHRVSKALQTAQEKWQRDADARLDAARTEAEKLARMTAEQKAEHERKAREKALTDREAALAKRELRAQAGETLAQKGLPAALLDAMHDATQSRIDSRLQAKSAHFWTLPVWSRWQDLNTIEHVIEL